jgi:hypothetical protein
VSSRPDAHLFIVPSCPDVCHTVRTSFRLRHHPSGRCGFPSRHSYVSRSFCSSLHPSRRLSSPFGRLTVFDQASDFLSKNKYGEITVAVRTTWIPGRTRYSLRQVRNSNSTVRTPVYHGPDARTTDMEIACRRSTVQTAILLVRTHEALIRKLLAADVRPSGRQCLTVRTRLSRRKDFQRKSHNFGRTVVCLDGP